MNLTDEDSRLVTVAMCSLAQRSLGSSALEKNGPFAFQGLGLVVLSQLSNSFVLLTVVADIGLESSN